MLIKKSETIKIESVKGKFPTLLYYTEVWCKYADDYRPEVQDFIFDAYNYVCLDELQAMRRGELEKLNGDGELNDAAIKAIYGKQDFAKNFPYDPNNRYYPPKTNMYYSYIFDMSKADAERASYFPSFLTYKRLLAKAEEKIQELYNYAMQET